MWADLLDCRFVDPTEIIGFRNDGRLDERSYQVIHRQFKKITFREYRELGNGGIKVLHRDTIVPVADVNIPINVRHSLMPESAGTMVVSERENIDGTEVIGVAGKDGYASLNIHKFGGRISRRLFSALDDAAIQVAHDVLIR